MLRAWEGQYEEAEAVCRRAVELQDQYISGHAGLQVVGANARLGYVFYLQGRYEDAIREYERGLAFVASSDHALKERTVIELNAKLGAAYLRLDKQDDANRFFDRALKAFDSRVANGADDPFTRYYIAGVYALRSDPQRALESLERVSKALPALTAARLRRDPDFDTLRDEDRFRALLQ